MAARHESEEIIPPLNYTQKAYEILYKAVDDPSFQNDDLSIIYKTLTEDFPVIHFGDHLKRYIYQKAQMEGDYQEIPLSDYRQIICDSFRDRHVPASFTPNSAKVSNLAKNWLTQKTVNRNVVLLLGFGLGMSLEDVNSFLKKAILDQQLNAKDPFEVICWYCYSNSLSYLKFDQLWKKFTAEDWHVPIPETLDATTRFQENLRTVHNEEQLWRYLHTLRIYPGTFRQSVVARQQFDLLYAETRSFVAKMLSEMEEIDSDVFIERKQEELERSDHYYDYQKKEIIDLQKKRIPLYGTVEIKASDVERIYYASIPKDQNGNLLSMKASSFFSLFSDSRLSRQRIGEILAGRAPITRSDLITLNFFAFARKVDQYKTRNLRYSKFVESTNDTLKKSGMEPVYLVNPYESFIMMCILSDDPLGTFSDVWELSYTDKEEE